MTTDQLADQRLLNQQIVYPTCTQPHDVVHGLGAVQAQDYRAALWAVGLRMTQATEQTIEQALAERTIVRTWPMRGTIHFVAAADVRWILALLAPRVVQRSTRRRAQLGLDDPTIAASAEVITRALEGGKYLPRTTLYELLEQANISTHASRGLHILGRLAHDGLLCFGTHAGKQPTFALLDEWVPATPALPHEEALARLTIRYFTSHGPATVQDCMWWSGLSTREVKAGLAAVGPQLERTRIEDHDYYAAPQQHDAAVPSPAAALLPSFDEFLVGYRDRRAVLDPQYNARIVPGGNGVFNPIIVIDGRVVGTWKRTLNKETVVLTFTPFTAFTNAQRSTITAAAQRYADFVGKRAIIDL